MTDNRLNARLWVDAHVRTCHLNHMPAFVVAKGDEARGGILLKVNRFGAGVFTFEQSLNFDGEKIWRRLGPESGEAEAEADARIAKKRAFDSDLWVVEIEDMAAAYAPDAPISDF